MRQQGHHEGGARDRGRDARAGGTRQGHLQRQRLQRLPHLRTGLGDREDRARPRQARVLRERCEPTPAEVHARIDRQSERVRREGLPERRHAVVQAAPRERRQRARRLLDEAARLTVQLPSDFPRDVAAIACDLDRTLIAEDAVLRPRTRDAIARVRATGAHVVLVTGRMFQAVRPYALEAGIDDPVICYQGAVVADPRTGTWLRHVPIALPLAREAIEALHAEGFGMNCYVDDELYVAEITPEARQYADFQHIELHAVGDLLEWLRVPPTKLVVIGEPIVLDGLEGVRHRGRKRARTRQGGRAIRLSLGRRRGRRAGARGIPRLPRMIDLRLARANPDIFREALARKGAAERFDELLAADRTWAEATQRRDEARAEQKRLGKPSSPEDIERARAFKQELQQLDDALAEAERERKRLWDAVPNPPHPTAPDGDSDDDAELVRTWGSPPELPFTPRDHVELSEGGIELERAARTSGSRFVYRIGDVALVELALYRFALDRLVSRGFV
ncbi:MAG: HAD hydrolase family protein, partial [Acidobacteria bacterium]|nr:HAD hydrolase family protein [Acidobacteriota bacterium]